MKHIIKRLIQLTILTSIISWGGISAFAAENLPDIIAKVRPSVVSISVDGTIKPKKQGPNMSRTPFGLFMNPFQSRRIHITGSGFIIAVKNKKIIPASKCDVRGVKCYVVTNNHVVKNDKKGQITIQLLDDATEFESTMAAHDDATDIAILNIPKEFSSHLKSLTLENSDDLRIGDSVIAIGNPLGRLPGTVSSGIISGVRRNINDGPYDSFIQTDAAINKGNSGGPLIDYAGHVIGINTAIYSSSGGSEGIGFAIPSNRVHLIVNKLLKYGKVERAALGITIQPITSEIANSLGLHLKNGALVQSVSPKSPAKGILKTGDIILTFNGKVVKKSSDLAWMVAQQPIGSNVILGIYRKGKKIKVHIKLKSYNAVIKSQKSGKGFMQDSITHEKNIPELGMTLGQMKDTNTNKMIVVVTKVTPNTRASFINIVPGMVIQAIKQKPMHSVKQVETLIHNVVKNAHGNQVAVMLTIRDPGGIGRYPGEIFVGLWLNVKKHK